jgi:hypothetical protein
MPRTQTPTVTDMPLGTRAVRGRVRRTGWSRLAYGLYATTQRSLIEELHAWSLVLPPGAAFTHLTAVEVLGWWRPAPVAHPVFAALRVGDPTPHRSGLFVSRHPNRPPTEIYDGVRLTTAAETMLAVARDLGILDLVIIGDSALRLNQCSLAELTEMAAQRRRGAPMLRRIIGMLDRRSESPWESVMRVLHRAAEIEVEPQYELFDQWGRFVARADLRITGTRRLHEYDGAGHRDAAVHLSDLDRDRRIVELGWQRCGFTARQLLRDGASIIASADRLLGRSWDPRPLARWNHLVDDSLYGPAGRARALSNWRRARASD